MLQIIARSPVKLLHLLVVNAAAVLITNFFIFFLLGKDSGYLRSRETGRSPVYLFLTMLALYPAIYYQMRKNYKNGRLPEAKSYLIAGLIVLVCIGVIGYVLLV